MLVINQVSKTYLGKVKAISKVSLTIEPGDIYGFVGHNGAGKTTLLKAISGIINIDEGLITLDGLNHEKDGIMFKKKIAYIPDHPDLYESLTGREFIDFVADVFAVPLPVRNERIVMYADLFDMTDKLKNPIATYSHGMKQKTALISALVHKPRLLLLDEPFIGLDPKAAFALKQIFKSLTLEGTMIFFSSHVLEVVEKLTNKIAIIKNGEIIASGLTKDVIKDQSLEQFLVELT
jgi:ABC-2 type transport system ATP-binding protein